MRSGQLDWLKLSRIVRGRRNKWARRGAARRILDGPRANVDAARGAQSLVRVLIAMGSRGCRMRRAPAMPRKSARKKADPVTGVLNFNVDNRTYQIDPNRQKVYRSFVEIETSKAFEIYSLWRSKVASA
jgi:hypothetical protein